MTLIFAERSGGTILSELRGREQNGNADLEDSCLSNDVLGIDRTAANATVEP